MAHHVTDHINKFSFFVMIKKILSFHNQLWPDLLGHIKMIVPKHLLAKPILVPFSQKEKIFLMEESVFCSVLTSVLLSGVEVSEFEHGFK